MTFAIANFQPIGGQSKRGKSPQHFAYRTTDALTTIDGAGYFNDVAEMLSVGDVIHVSIADSADTPTSVTGAGTFIVASSSAGVVDTYDALKGNNIVTLNAYLADISTAGQIYVVSPVAGTIQKIYSTINGAIATADATLTPKIAGTAVTDGAITVAYSGSAAGDVDSSTPSAANTVTAGQAIEVETDGASTNTIPVMITIEIKPSVVDSD